MKWEFSDGTVAHLGGDVEGATVFAQRLRSAIASSDTTVSIWPEPSESVALDVEDPAIFDRFLRNEVAIPALGWMMTSLVRAPEVPPLPDPPWDDEDDGIPMIH